MFVNSCRIAKSLVVCLESKDYVQIRNALTILFKILPYFPVLQQLASVVEKRIEKVRKEKIMLILVSVSVKCRSRC